jgi:hypothetical protein
MRLLHGPALSCRDLKDSLRRAFQRNAAAANAVLASQNDRRAANDILRGFAHPNALARCIQIIRQPEFSICSFRPLEQAGNEGSSIRHAGESGPLVNSP